MNLNEILKEIKELNISKDDFYIEGDAALVVREIIDNADTIKICMNKDMIKFLVNTHKVVAKDTKHFIYNKIEINTLFITRKTKRNVTRYKTGIYRDRKRRRI